MRPYSDGGTRLSRRIVQHLKDWLINSPWLNHPITPMAIQTACFFHIFDILPMLSFFPSAVEVLPVPSPTPPPPTKTPTRSVSKPPNLFPNRNRNGRNTGGTLAPGSRRAFTEAPGGHHRTSHEGGAQRGGALLRRHRALEIERWVGWSDLLIRPFVKYKPPEMLVHFI